MFIRFFFSITRYILKSFYAVLCEIRKREKSWLYKRNILENIRLLFYLRRVRQCLRVAMCVYTLVRTRRALYGAVTREFYITDHMIPQSHYTEPSQLSCHEEFQWLVWLTRDRTPDLAVVELMPWRLRHVTGRHTSISAYTHPWAYTKRSLWNELYLLVKKKLAVESVGWMNIKARVRQSFRRKPVHHIGICSVELYICYPGIVLIQFYLDLQI